MPHWEKKDNWANGNRLMGKGDTGERELWMGKKGKAKGKLEGTASRGIAE